MKKIVALTMSALVAASMFTGTVFAEETTEEQVSEVVEEVSEAAAETTEAAEAPEAETAPEVNLSENGEIIMDDYSTIQIPKSQITVTEDEIASTMQSVVSYYTTQEQVTEGTAEAGDNVNINFKGVLEGETEPFDGGTAEGYDVVLGMGTFIPGFEDQIIGHEIGETFDINVAFPEDYAEALAGKNAIFTITINYKTVTNVPELTDELVQQFSSENLDTQLNSVDELREYTENMIYNNKLSSAMITALQDKVEIISYNEDQFNKMKEYSLSSLKMYSMYGYDEDTAAMMFGYPSADAYTSDEACYYVGIFMMLDKIAADLGVTYTDEDVDAAIEDYMKSYGYDETYSLEEFKEMSGEGWVLLLSKVDVEYGLVVDALKDRVEVIDDDVAENN